MRGSQNQKIVPALPEGLQDDEDVDLPVTPLTAEQAEQLRGRLRQVSPWWVVGAQLVAGSLAAWAAGAWSGQAAIGWSLAWGAFAVALPAGVFARALRRGAGSMILLWEWVKLGLTVALLLAGVVLATKMYWVAFVFARRRRLTGN